MLTPIGKGSMKKTESRKVMISRRALFQRINRVLAKRGQLLKTNRARQLGAGRHDLGRYFIVDLDRNSLVNLNADPVALGEELEVIAAYEAVEEES
jgi:hypothetical protein